jgi:hypothetical protein
LNHAYLGVRNAELQVRDASDIGHAADMSKAKRMTHCGHSTDPALGIGLSAVLTLARFDLQILSQSTENKI